MVRIIYHGTKKDLKEAIDETIQDLKNDENQEYIKELEEFRIIMLNDFNKLSKYAYINYKNIELEDFSQKIRSKITIDQSEYEYILKNPNGIHTINFEMIFFNLFLFSLILLLIIWIYCYFYDINLLISSNGLIEYNLEENLIH